jgi:hypothetical protein
MKTPVQLRPERLQRHVARLGPVMPRLRRAASRGLRKRRWSHGSRGGHALPRLTGGPVGRLVGRRR